MEFGVAEKFSSGYCATKSFASTIPPQPRHPIATVIANYRLKSKPRLDSRNQIFKMPITNAVIVQAGDRVK